MKDTSEKVKRAYLGHKGESDGVLAELAGVSRPTFKLYADKLFPKRKVVRKTHVYLGFRERKSCYDSIEADKMWGNSGVAF